MSEISQRETRVAATARKLAQLSMAAEDGAFIGAEDEFLVQLGVSRPTLRQAAKIAENDRLISVRRGIKGGFYASRPDAADSIRTLARYLRLKGATLSDIMVVSRLVAEEAVERACACKDQGLRTRLAEFAERIGENDTPAQLIVAEGELVRLLTAMSGNPAIELVMAIGYSFGMEEQGVALYRDPVLDCDAEIARVIMRRRSVTMSGWIDGASRERA
jgi:GntR family transcriptional repressor for pyruvate dehydrogenase complex